MPSPKMGAQKDQFLPSKTCDSSSSPHLLGMQPRRNVLPIHLFRVKKPSTFPRFPLKLNFIPHSTEMRTSQSQTSFRGCFTCRKCGIFITFIGGSRITTSASSAIQ